MIRKINNRLKHLYIKYESFFKIFNLIEHISNVFFGKPRDVEHIWKPGNYQKFNNSYWHLVQKPLQKRGIYLPLNFKKVHSLNEFKTFHDEHIVLDKYLKKVSKNDIENCYLDIGASDGVDMSNTFNLALEDYEGYLFELNDSKFSKLSTIYQDFSKISLFKTKITPDNAVSFLKALDLPDVIKVLNLDIDSYDYFVLEELLKEFKFQFLILEINPLFPMSVDFTVTYDEEFEWPGNSFQGASLSMFYKLLDKSSYSIVHLDRAFIFAVNNSYLNEEIKKIDPKNFDSILNESLIKKDFSRWNDRYEEYRGINENEIISKISELFKDYSNYYISKSDLSI